MVGMPSLFNMPATAPAEPCSYELVCAAAGTADGHMTQWAAAATTQRLTHATAAARQRTAAMETG